MHRLLFYVSFVFIAAGCAHAPVAPARVSESSSRDQVCGLPSAVCSKPLVLGAAARASVDVAVAAAPASETPPRLAEAPGASSTAEEAALDDGEGEADEEEDPEEAAIPSADEGEPHDVAQPDGPVPFRYTAELTDEMLAELWKRSPESLGSISLGFVDEGRIINGIQFPKGDGWIVVSPEKTYGTQETVDAILTVIKSVREQYPDAPPLRVNQISAKDGGWMRPHKSHQSGRDADLAFFYPTAEPVRARAREKYIDVQKTWALLKAVITLTDVQFVLVDRHVQRVLYDHALANGEDAEWLDSIFRGPKPLVMHARGHRDHFHVRFYNPRAQELGRRVAPLLAQRPDQNLVMHRVHKGDTLSQLAVRYNSTVAAIRKANRMRGSFLRIRQVLKIPLRGPCTRCPIPPPIEVPARRLPPGFEVTPAAPAMVEAPQSPEPQAEASVAAAAVLGSEATSTGGTVATVSAPPAVVPEPPATTATRTTEAPALSPVAPGGGSGVGAASPAAASSPAAR